MRQNKLGCGIIICMAVGVLLTGYDETRIPGFLLWAALLIIVIVRTHD